ncbi:Ref family recombination enhancement nuclease [Noviherbaspirillum saxi]|nr:Ref family recombination enhancement nuclease [Noviherbaspirillum saxi]
MKRSPLKRKTPMNRGAKSLKAAGFASDRKQEHKLALKSGTKRLRSRKVPPTLEEREWMSFVASFGCVVCWLQKKVKSPCAVHHIVEGGQRKGHMWTIGLCDPGHHQGAPTGSEKISRHPWKKRFEAEYGTEYELHSYLVEQRKLLDGKGK